MARLFDDGDSEYLEWSGAPPVTAPPFTMACWGRSDDDGANQVLMFLGDKDDEYNYWFLMLTGGVAGDFLRFQVRNASNEAAITSGGYTANSWHHCAGVAAAADDRSVLIDGGSKGTNAVSVIPAGVDRISIGRAGDSTPTGYMSGRIAWPAIWNVALSDAEVASLAAGTHPTRIRPANLVAFWPLGGLDGRHDRDVWGGYDMTAVNGPTWADHSGGLIYPAAPQLVIPSAAAPPAFGGVNTILGSGVAA